MVPAEQPRPGGIRTRPHDQAIALPTVRGSAFDPPAELGMIRESQPLCRLVYPDGHLGWLVTSYDLARAILADPRYSVRAELKRVPVARPGADPFIGKPTLPGWFVDLDPPEHTRFRRLLTKQFTSRRLARLKPQIERLVLACLDDLERAGSPADLVDMFALPIPSVIICELMGVPYADRVGFQRDSTILFSLAATAEDGVAAMERLTGYLLDLIRHKRIRPADDLLSDLAGGGELTDEEIAGAGVLLLTAGHETVASMIGLGAFVLLCHPGQLELLRTGSVAIDDAVEELLRYLTIFQFGVPRAPREDVELMGEQIKAGECVTVSISAANRDPARFTQPDMLDLTRTARGHFAFGHGMHQCIGQNLARVEMHVAYTELFTRFPTLRLAVPAQEVPLTRAGFHGVHRLPVEW